MAKRRGGGAGASPVRHSAVLSGLVALVVALSAVIYVMVAADDGTPRTTADNRPHHGSSAAPASTGTWVGAWSTAPVGGEPGTEAGGMAGRSVRNIVHASTGGTSARVTLSNLYGQSPLTITHASLAVSAGDGTAAADAETMRRLTFGGVTSVVIPPGGQVLSDAVPVTVPHDSDVLVTTYSPTPSGPVTYHPHARQVSYVAEGDRTEDATGTPYTEQTPYWRYLTALDVLSNEATGTVVVFGDSITDGITSTVGANHRWPDVLAGRLRSAVESGDDLPRYGIVNEGISGNQVLADGLGRPAENQSGLGRFGRDVLSRTNVKVVVIDLGVNDILRNPKLADPNRITDGLRALVRQAHARGLKVVGATLMPFKGHRGYTPAREAVRRQVNAEIRSGRVYDTVVDFDRALKDPYDPRRLRPDYDSGDHLHPSDLGFARMGEVFDLGALKGAGQAEL
ncbi:lysophospholipase L1-like esterase [Streptomyces griseochromogenes]|uniref:Lysophospholipase L1-like esterase n=1 Tax=Streptomyces griseochromogenes TaxID=68214 RepID=A0A1B1B966_9ACTN|nr:SGNH/GDSL hydrolase family protein [Streptomyces griseochromogenes]ANP55329.1 SGNH hydrolase [Streptomyces griseochromogenes]MBP2054445.1 lysophospholipase L1-like esterase [Streptomyces griseochromogenes]